MNINDIKSFRRQSDATILAILEQHRATNEALAATIQQLRDGISMCVAYKCQPSKELLRVGYDAESILAERDAQTLRMAAEVCDVHAMMATNQDGAEWANSCKTAILAKADELTKQGIST